jgi:hypothetical protein
MAGSKVARVASASTSRQTTPDQWGRSLRAIFLSCRPEDQQYSRFQKLVRPRNSHWITSPPIEGFAHPYQSPQPQQNKSPCQANLYFKPLRVRTQCSQQLVAPNADILTCRQAYCPSYPRRAQSLLRQRAYFPLMAQLHRHPRWPCRWPPQLRRPRRTD